jgi:CHAT domain-containing protein
MRSGLLLSYAHKAWTFGNNEERVEDGILNSAEIANLDFSNTELVVLSACETGLGDIEGNEGVMGLQRGFRMAGVNNLVVSLWPVLDEETAEFMTLFYKNLMNSSDMRSAFNATQKAMHEKYGDEPYKWAGFVLIE